MRILLTNDDGVDSPGLTTLERELSRDHEVWVVAPAGERSGMSHYITLRGPISLQARGERRFACSGSPADCVMIMKKADFLSEVDLVISGINRGPNLGTDVVYSGTAAAARQAALMGIPGIATSLAATEGPWDYREAAEFLARHASDLARAWSPDHFLNINFPPRLKKPWKTRLTVPCRRHYSDRLVTYTAPDGEKFCFVEGFITEGKDLDGSDWHAVMEGCIALTPVAVHPAAVDTRAYGPWREEAP